MRTMVYVDGFNLYYRALRGTGFKWLDIDKLCRSVLDPANKIEEIKYYTANISGKFDKDAPTRQQIYLRALRSIPNLTIYRGRFLTTTSKGPCVSQPSKIGHIYRSEEKGSDVNLAVHLVADGFRDAYDAAVVLSNDTDLVEPIRLVNEELRKPVGVICPASKCAGQLARTRSLRPPHLQAEAAPSSISKTNQRNQSS